MAPATQNRIERILEEYLSAVSVSEELAEKFRVWFSGNGHLEEKYFILQVMLESKIVFDPNPGKEVYESYEKVARMLGFDEEQGGGEDWKKNRRPLRRRTALRIAAVVLPVAVMFGAAFYMWQMASDADQLPVVAEIYLTVPEGEKKHTTLPDSSSVWINSASELSYEDDFEAQRVVRLEGEAFFSVNNTGGKPFRVSSQGLTATALGTAFNIANDMDNGITVVSLYEGQLRIDTPESIYLMVGGQELEYNQLTGRVYINEMARTKPEWMRDIIDFSQKPASEVLNSLGRIYGYNISMSNSEPVDDIVTLKFEDEISFEDVMSIMSEISGFTYRVYGKEVYVTKK